MCTLRSLARSLSAIGGHDNDYDGKLMMLLDERTETSKLMKRWLGRLNRLLSHECINELRPVRAVHPIVKFCSTHAQ